MLNAAELIEKGKPEYIKIGMKGALEQLLDYFEANPVKDDHRIYGWLSALDRLLHEERSPAEMLDGIAPDEGLDNEEFWSHYLAQSWPH